MIDQRLYVDGKLRELASERRDPLSLPPSRPPRPPAGRRVVGPLARAAGRRVRRVGEALESWAAAPTQAR
jgi:hypothetical protein